MGAESGRKGERDLDWAVVAILKREIYLQPSAGHESQTYHLPGAMVECVWVGGGALPIVREACVWWLLGSDTNCWLGTPPGLAHAYQAYHAYHAYTPRPTAPAAHRQKLLLLTDYCC